MTLENADDELAVVVHRGEFLTRADELAHDELALSAGRLSVQVSWFADVCISNSGPLVGGCSAVGQRAAFGGESRGVKIRARIGNDISVRCKGLLRETFCRDLYVEVADVDGDGHCSGAIEGC